MQPSSIMRANATLWAACFLYWLLASRRSARSVSSESALARLRHVGLLVLAFLALFGDAAAIPPLSDRFLPDQPLFGWAGDVITACGLAFAIWARTHLGRFWSGKITVKAGHKLVTTGPYRIVRHPIYTGVLFGAIGSAIALGELRGLTAIVIVLGAYLWKIRAEEAVLRKALGRQYEDYRSEVRALIPFII